MDSEMGKRVANHVRIVVLLSLGLASIFAGCSDNGGDLQNRTAATSGSELVVLLGATSGGSWPSGLDPATNTSSSLNLSIMNAVFGGLFQIVANEDGSDPRITGVLASGYEIQDEGRTLVIHLREGVRFTDGTPLNAEAVRINIERNLAAPCSCAPTRWPWRDENRVVVSDNLTVSLHFDRPYPAAINSFPVLNINWPASPSAISSVAPEDFRMHPVGAGPFKIVSNQLSTRLVLERNPDYWQPGRPYIDRLVFQSVASEQSAYLALVAGDAQVAEGIVSSDIIEQALGHAELTVTMQPATATYVVQLNTRVPPFDEIRARQSTYHATDVQAIRAGLFNDRVPISQTFTGPGGLFHHDRIPGYPSFDLERARALVRAVGGLNATIVVGQSFIYQRMATALQSQWRDAGIEAEIETLEVGEMVERLQAGNWQVMLQRVGSFDPESSGGVSLRFASAQPFSGVSDATLDALLADAAATTDSSERDAKYFEAAKRISDNAYAPFLVAFGSAQLAVKGVTGPGLTTAIPPAIYYPAILWQDVAVPP